MLAWKSDSHEIKKRGQRCRSSGIQTFEFHWAGASVASHLIHSFALVFSSILRFQIENMKTGNGVLCCHLELLAAPDLPPVLEPSHLKGWGPRYLTLKDNIWAFKSVHRAWHLAKNRWFYKKRITSICVSFLPWMGFWIAAGSNIFRKGAYAYIVNTCLAFKYVASPLKKSQHSESKGQKMWYFCTC